MLAFRDSQLFLNGMTYKTAILCLDSIPYGWVLAFLDQHKTTV